MRWQSNGEMSFCPSSTTENRYPRLFDPCITNSHGEPDVSCWRLHGDLYYILQQGLRAPLSLALCSPEKTAGTSARQVFGHISSVWCSNARLSPQFFGVAGVSQRGARPKATWLVGRSYSLQRRCRAKPPPPHKAYGLQKPTGSLVHPLSPAAAPLHGRVAVNPHIAQQRFASLSVPR